MMDGISQKQFYQLVDLGAVRSIYAVPAVVEPGWVIEVRLQNGTTESLINKLKERRVFKAADSLIKFVASAGINSIEFQQFNNWSGA